MIHISIKNRYLFVLFSLLIFYNVSVLAQVNSRTGKQFEKALQYFKTRDYNQAIQECEKIIERNPEFAESYLLLAEIYNESDSVKREINALEKAKQYSKNPVISIRLAEAYYSIGLYSKALPNFEEYLTTEGITVVRQNEIKRKIQSCKFAINAIKNPVSFEPKRLNQNINTNDDEYWPVLSLDGQQLVFTRLITETGRMPQEDFYTSEFDSVITWKTARPISAINTGRNEGAETLSADGSMLFFTACNRQDGYGSCDIYFSKKENENWSTPVNVGNPVSTSQWEGQPSFSSDNRYLYFSSNREGGKGLKDIWRAEFLGINNNGIPRWSTVENLGESVNTPGNEISPFIHANNNDLYFASDYHIGMGNMDLFHVKIGGLQTISTPKNLGYPINTFNDEQGLTISGDGTVAYFASSRYEKTGLDIYSFELDERIRPNPVTYVKAKVINAETKEIVQASVELENTTNPQTKERLEKTNNEGEILLCLPMGSNYLFTVSEEGFLFYSQSFQLNDSKGLQNPFLLTIELNPIEIGAEMNLYNIYFETDSFSILPESYPELHKLFTFLQNNPDLNVELQGHTDNSGNIEANKVLSEKRAESVFDYLKMQGINENRIQYKGYGDSHPVASNETPEGRSRNRRTTILILNN